MKYRISFVGSPKGHPVQSRERVTQLVEAYSPASARLMAYDTHEHITGGLCGVQVEEVYVEHYRGSGLDRATPLPPPTRLSALPGVRVL